MIARFRKGDKVRWNALALHGDDRNGWTVEGLDEAKGLFPIYLVRKGKQAGSAVQSDLEPCPTHARLQREAQTSGAMVEPMLPRGVADETPARFGSQRAIGECERNGGHQWANMCKRCGAVDQQ